VTRLRERLLLGRGALSVRARAMHGHGNGNFDSGTCGCVPCGGRKRAVVHVRVSVGAFWQKCHGRPAGAALVSACVGRPAPPAELLCCTCVRTRVHIVELSFYASLPTTTTGLVQLLFHGGADAKEIKCKYATRHVGSAVRSRWREREREREIDPGVDGACCAPRERQGGGRQRRRVPRATTSPVAPPKPSSRRSIHRYYFYAPALQARPAESQRRTTTPTCRRHPGPVRRSTTRRQY
jgi:hypothetical protein